MASVKANEDNFGQFMVESMKVNGGAACAVTKDGVVMMLSKQMIANLLSECESKGQDKVIILVKRSQPSELS